MCFRAMEAELLVLETQEERLLIFEMQIMSAKSRIQHAVAVVSSGLPLWPLAFRSIAEAR